MADARPDQNDQPLYVSPEAAAIAAEEDGPPPPAWPKVIGIISIVFGALGIICGGMGIGWQLMAGSVLGNIPGGAPPALTNPNPVAIGLGAVGILWSVVLIVAGSMTAGRKPSGRITHLVWAVVAIILGAGSMYMQVSVQKEVDAWCANNPDADFAKQQAAGGGIGQTIGYACGGVFGFGWPLFTLVWFGMVKRDPNALAAGVTEQVA